MAVLIEKVSFLLSRFRWIQTYYHNHHLDLALPGCLLSDAHGTVLGYIEELRLHQGRLHLRGWALVPRLAIRLGETQIWRTPQDEREDVALVIGCDPHVGFRASLPFDEGLLLLELDTAEGLLTIYHEMGVAEAKRRAKWGLRWRFWRDTLPLVPMILYGLWSGNANLPRRVKAALRLGLAESALSLNAAFLTSGDGSDVTPASPKFVTLIMPIYNAFDLLPEALDRVMAHTDVPFRLIVIDDASPDERVRPWLREWVGRQPPEACIDLIENAENLGFIGSVNRGFDLVQAGMNHGPVVLLNSDAMVPADWASRLVSPLADPAIATATPLSNDAEIFNVPVICVRSALQSGQADKIDAALRARITPQFPRSAAPTGVGFCMALQREWLMRLGGLDPAFGRGYGEEVDWCRRAAAQGGRHVAVTNLFVEHRGGASFGSEKMALVKKNNAIIAARYPRYDQLVQDFIREDPLITARMIATFAWADSLPEIQELPVYIGHSMGGGAENYLQDRIRKDKVSVVVRLGGACRCRLEVETPQGRLVANTDDLDLVVRLLAPITKRRIIYSCAVGDSDLSELPELLRRLSTGAALDILLHDYLPLSPSYTLLDHDGVYRGVPEPETTDPAHTYRCPDGTIMSLKAWRSAWDPVITLADRVQVFSEASAEIVVAAYPKVRARIVVTPHTLLQPILRLDPLGGDRIVIGVLGAIGPQKGALVLDALSKMLAGRADMGLVLIGRIAPGYTLANDTVVHGTYAIEDIGHLAARYGVTHWLIPSVWPETFSYTVHECLATELPTLAFDLGAQGDAVRIAPNGILLPWSTGHQDPAQMAQQIIDLLRKSPVTG